jgi:hypothetical protein
MKNLSTLIIILVFTVQLKAQCNFPNYASDNDKLSFSSHCGRHYKSLTYKMGQQEISRHDFCECLKTNKASAVQFKKFQNSMIAASIILGLSFNALLATTVSAPNLIRFPLYGSLIALVEAIVAEHHFTKSIKLYNQEMNKHKTLQTT